jgi:RNA polymerase sigma-70 factor (ECF subfamily)
MEETHDSRESELRALMMAGLDGDAVPYHALLERLTGHLRAYYRHRFLRIGHGPTEAEDLVQETLIGIHTHRHTYDPSQRFTPWVYAIARYKFLDYLRRQKSSLNDIPVESAEELVANSQTSVVESSLDLKRLMVKISPKARQAIHYLKVQRLSASEAAARCRMSESAVKIAAHRGLKALVLLIAKETQT